MLRGATLGTLNTTMSVTTSTLQSTMNVTNTAVNSMIGLGKGSSDDQQDALGTSSTGKLSNASTSKASAAAGGKSGAAATANSTVVPTGKVKNNFLSVLSSDQPRENVDTAQLKVRIRIVEEKD